MTPQILTPTKLYKVPELSEAWGVSERSIRRAIADGRLQCVRIGRSVRVSDAQMKNFIEGQSSEA